MVPNFVACISIHFKDNNISFKYLLQNDNLFAADHRNIESLAIELFQVKENLSNTILNATFQTRTPTYNLKLFCLKSVNKFHQILRMHFLKNWDSLYAWLNSRYKAWNYNNKKHKKIKAYRRPL